MTPSMSAIRIKRLPTPRFLWKQRIYRPPIVFDDCPEFYLHLLSEGVQAEDEYTIRLRATEGLPWSLVAKRYQNKFGVTTTSSALRRRYSRLWKKYHSLYGKRETCLRVRSRRPPILQQRRRRSFGRRSLAWWKPSVWSLLGSHDMIGRVVCTFSLRSLN